MRAAVLLFPGLNRENDAMRALHQASGVKPTLVWHTDHELPKGTDIVVIPGGFSYGDYLRCGAIAGRANIMHAVRAHAERGGLVLGICNGFQILCESGLLPGVLMRNSNLRFICRMQHLRVERVDTPFTGKYAQGPDHRGLRRAWRRQLHRRRRHAGAPRRRGPRRVPLQRQGRKDWRGRQLQRLDE